MPYGFPPNHRTEVVPADRASKERYGPPPATHQKAYSQLHCECPKRWHVCIAVNLLEPRKYPPTLARLRFRYVNTCSAPQGKAKLIQISEGGRAILGVVLVMTAGFLLRDSQDATVQGFEHLCDDALRHTTNQVHQKPSNNSSGSLKVWKIIPSFPSRNRGAMTAAMNISAFDRTTINFSPFSWAVRPQGRLPAHKPGDTNT